MTGKSAFEQSKAKQTSSSGRLFGRSVVYGKEDDARTPYMTRYWIGRLRLHIFHRGDADPDCHDHPWDFWTFPLTSYVEEVAIMRRETIMEGEEARPPRYDQHTQIVPAFRLTYRPATHCHRVLGPYSGNVADPFGHIIPCSASRAAELPASFKPYYDVGAPGRPARKIVTLVWRGKEGRTWGFLKRRDGRWCWVHWKEYVFGGGKSAPCE